MPIENMKIQVGRENNENRGVVFISCNIIFALCLTGAVALSYVHKQNEEQAIIKHAKMLVESLEVEQGHNS